MEILTGLGRTLGFSFAAGINLYATVAILGLTTRFGWVDLPPQFEVFDNNWIIGLAAFLYVVEFFADKVPWVDTLWDAIHTVIRPIGGALIAVASAGSTSPSTQVVIGLVGAALATSSHLTKAGTRAMANTSPEPFTNWGLSLVEDGFVVALGVLALQHPALAAIVVLICVAIIVSLAYWLIGALARRFRRIPHTPPDGRFA